LECPEREEEGSRKKSESSLILDYLTIQCYVFSVRIDVFSTVVFMDVWLKIEEKNVVTSLYAKPMVLHLYIPSHSCHVPGLFPGIVFGTVLQIHKLCTRAVDVT
jgi:hypothetical protein